VAEFHRSSAIPCPHPELARELTRQMAPVTAPEALWDRLKTGRPQRRGSLEWVFWPVAAAMVLLAFAGVLRTLKVQRNPHDRLTEQELAVAAAPRGFEFRSDNFEESRAWVKEQANIDIDVPSRQPAADRGTVRLLGARLIRVHGLPVAVIDYHVGDEVATLLVSGKRPGLTGNTEVSPHLFSQIKTAGNERLLSWNMRNQTYTIAFSGMKNSHAACLLCHSVTPG
jgi:anti-sigma factor RsiW